MDKNKKPLNHTIQRLLKRIDSLYVGVARFELATSWSQTRRDDRTTLHPEQTKNNNTKQTRTIKKERPGVPLTYVIPKRFERLTYCLEGSCSIQLSYGINDLNNSYTQSFIQIESLVKQKKFQVNLKL